MRKTLYLMIAATALLLAGCDRPASIESVDALEANPERLRELRAACKADHAKVGDAQCNAVAEATRQRFMRAAPSPYAQDWAHPPAQAAGPAQ